MEVDNTLYIKFLEEKVARLERSDKLKSSAYPHNAFISGESVTFCYDEAQIRPLGRNDKFIFRLKSISLDSFKRFLKTHAKDLSLYPWLCMEGGEGYYDNVIDRELYNQCFTIRLSECLHKMIETDNDLMLSLLKIEQKECYERNR